jgi:hypothetical protein
VVAGPLVLGRRGRPQRQPPTVTGRSGASRQLPSPPLLRPDRITINRVPDQSVFSGAHSDIRHPEVIWASLAAGLM